MATTIGSTTSTVAGTITSPGIGSGLDINGIITKLMALESQPLTVLNTREASYQAKLSAYGTLNSSVATLGSAVDALKAESLYSKFTATSSDSTIFTASANTAAKAGTHSIEVVGLAAAQTITSQVFSSTSTPISTIDGKLKIELGTYGSSFTPDANRSPVTIDIGATSSSLTEIRDKINAADAGVTARIVSVDSAGTQYKLAITSNTVGAAGSMRITALDANDVVLTNNADIAKLSFDPTKASGTGKEYDVSTVAADANVKVDGISIFRNSNTIGDAITGVSFTATKVGSATLTIAVDKASVETALSAFVKAYNDTVTLDRQLSAYNAQTGKGSLLTGDSAARSLLSELSRMIGLSGGTSSSVRRFSDMGISVQKDGTLKIDSTKLSAKLDFSMSEVKDFLSSTSATSKGVAVQIASRLEAITAENGLLVTRADSLNASIKALGNRRTQLQAQLTQIEANYRKQFTALDTLVASMQQTSSYLTQQLAGIQKSTSA